MGTPSARGVPCGPGQADRRQPGPPVAEAPPGAPAELRATAAEATLERHGGRRTGAPNELTFTGADTNAPPLVEGQAALRIAAPLESTTASSGRELRADLLREFRTQVRSLRVLLECIPGSAAPLDDVDYVERAVDGGDDLLTEAETARPRAARDQDALRRIRNTREEPKLSPLLKNPARADMVPEDPLRRATMPDAHRREIDVQIGSLTIPARPNGSLAMACSGYHVPSHAVFADHLPNPDDRTKMLTFLARSPEALPGDPVDASPGLVHRFDRDRRGQWQSLLGILGVVAGATALVATACYPRTGIDLDPVRLQVEAWPFVPGDRSTLLVGWDAVLAGVIVHGGVGTTKRMRAEAASPPVVAPTDLPPRVNATFGPSLLKPLLALIGFVGLVYKVDIGQVTLLTALLVGYSLNGVVEPFGTGLVQRTLAQTNRLRTTLGVPTAT